MVGERGESGIDLRGAGEYRLVSEYLRRQSGPATAERRGLVIDGLQDAEPPAGVEGVPVGDQLSAVTRVLRGGVPHTHPCGRLGRRCGLRTLQQIRDCQHLALERHGILLSQNGRRRPLDPIFTDSATDVPNRQARRLPSSPARAVSLRRSLCTVLQILNTRMLPAVERAHLSLTGSREAGVKGGVILFRSTGADARRYVEADRSRADEYYLGADNAAAAYAVVDATGKVTAERTLSAAEYEGCVNWVDPTTRVRMGIPRLPGQGRRGSPMFAEMVVNSPKSLSIAAALHPDVSDALDHAERDAVAEIRGWLGHHSVTRVGPRGRQEVVAVEQLQAVAIGHRTSRAGDPHRHVHLQIGARVWAAGRWRALDTGALFRQQGTIRALGAGVIAAHPQLAETLNRHGLSLDPASGEVAELEPFNAMMSKRWAQIRRNLAELDTAWEEQHPGVTPAPAVTARMQGTAWARERPAKKPADLHAGEWWRHELCEAGYDPDTLEHGTSTTAVSLDALSDQEVASRALDRCAATGSAWTRHTVQEHVARITTAAGVRATPRELCAFVDAATRVAVADCLSLLPPGVTQPEHVAHLTNLQVVAAETRLRDLLDAHLPGQPPQPSDVTEAARLAGLDDGQQAAAASVASDDPRVIVEGAAGAGKTTMLGVANDVASARGRGMRLVAPTRRAAQTAEREVGVPATSVAALVHAHGSRWNDDGVWTRLRAGDIDPGTGAVYAGPPEAARLKTGERVVVDEAGMLDQDTAIALLTITAEAGTCVALVGDRAQLSAVGRGGVLDLAAQIRGRTWAGRGL